jgi:integrase-like protein
MIMIKTKVKRTSYQSGFVQWRKNGQPTLRFRERDPNSPNGWKERRVTLPPGTTPKQARKKLDELIAIVNSNDSNPSAAATAAPSALTVAEFVQGTLWRSYLAKEKVKPSTAVAYDSMIRSHVLPHIGSLPLVDITPAFITHVLDSLSTKSSKYCLNLYALLNVIFEVASEHDLIEQSPVRRKLHRPVVENREKTPYTKDQIRLLSAYILPEHRLLLITAAVFGLRLGELLAIRWQDVDGDVLHIRHSLWRRQLQTPKTTASRRLW